MISIDGYKELVQPLGRVDGDAGARQSQLQFLAIDLAVAVQIDGFEDAPELPLGTGKKPLKLGVLNQACRP